MKSVGCYESPENEWWLRPIWKRPEFKGTFCNSILNFDHTKQYCILGYKTLVDCIDSLRELYINPKNDFFVLENSMSKEQLCSNLDSLGLSRIKCYAMKDCSWDELHKYFFLICKSTEHYEIWNSSESAYSIPHMSMLGLESQRVESVQVCNVDVASDLQSESPVLE